MSLFFDPTGLPTFGIALCARCSRKFSLVDLYPDPNYPGLMVCKEDLDTLDPYRLPARQTERINLDFVRPDLPLTGVAEPAVNLRVTDAADPRVTDAGDPREVVP